jgi:tripartite-type tricarboxylate transporter receptor subunit TctC
MPRHLRHLFALSLLASAAVATAQTASTSSGQAYPARPVKIVIPFPPGGTLDAVGRSLAQKLSEQMGQQFVVENKPGGNGTIGAADVAKAAADGYTLLFNASTFTSAPMTMKSVPYSVTRDFAPIALVGQAPLSVALSNKLGVTDIKGLVAAAKARPGALNFAVGSIGSAGHLCTVKLEQEAGIKLSIVPYKGTAPAFQDLIGGQIDGFVDPVLGSVNFHRGGQLKVAGVTSLRRLPNLPDVPTVSETIPNFECASWYGLWAPAKTPADLIQRLNAEANKAIAAEISNRFTPQGLVFTTGSADDFAKFQQADMARSQKIITDGNIRVE